MKKISLNSQNTMRGLIHYLLNNLTKNKHKKVSVEISLKKYMLRSNKHLNKTN